MPPSANPIVVPLDGSRIAEKAVALALAMASVYEAPVAFLHVIDESEVDATADDLEKTRASFRDYVARFVTGAEAGRPETSAEVVAGKPADAILERAREALMIAMATHGRGGFKAALLGGVTERVVRSAEVPVLVAPAEGDAPARPETILVALDGSTLAEAALPHARTIARKLGARIALVRAYPLMQPVGAEFALYPSYTANLVEAVEREAREYLAGTAEPGEEQLVLPGNAAAAIVEAAEQRGADLVVMTSSGKGLAARLLLGSTTNRVLHSLQRPLLVVPPPAEEDRD